MKKISKKSTGDRVANVIVKSVNVGMGALVIGTALIVVVGFPVMYVEVGKETNYKLDTKIEYGGKEYKIRDLYIVYNSNEYHLCRKEEDTHKEDDGPMYLYVGPLVVLDDSVTVLDEIRYIDIKNDKVVASKKKGEENSTLDNYTVQELCYFMSYHDYGKKIKDTHLLTEEDLLSELEEKGIKKTL